MKRLVALLVGVGIAATSGCNNADTAPLAGLVGTFVIASYNGAALPTYVDPRLGACSTKIVTGSFTTDERGHAVFSRAYSTPCTPGAAIGTDTRGGTVSVAGTTISVALDAGVLSTAEAYTGSLVGGELTLHRQVDGSSTPLEQIFVLMRP